MFSSKKYIQIETADPSSSAELPNVVRIVSSTEPAASERAAAAPTSVAGADPTLVAYQLISLIETGNAADAGAPQLWWRAMAQL